MLAKPFAVTKKVWMPTRFTGFDTEPSGRINLAGCENCCASPRVLQLFSNIDPRLLTDHWQSQDPRLRSKLATLHGVHPGQVFLTSGAESAISYIFEKWAKGGVRKAGLLQPDYPAFEHFIDRNSLDVRWLRSMQYPFTHNLNDVLRFVRKEDLPFLAISNPNGVTGTRKAVSEITISVASAPDTLFVIDEADATDTESAAHLTLTYPNLIVIRSFSKFYGLSGLRIGYIVTPSAFSDGFSRMINPAELTGLAILAATEVLDDIEYQRATQERVKRSLAMIEEACQGNTYRVVPGSSCFAAYLWADKGIEDPYTLLERHNIDIARGAGFGLDRGGRMNLSDPAKVRIAADVIRRTATK